MGYNVFYPSGVINEDDALAIVIRNLQLTLSLGLTVVVVYFVGYFVMRNVIVSKKKDYLIIRLEPVLEFKKSKKSAALKPLRTSSIDRLRNFIKKHNHNNSFKLQNYYYIISII